MWVAWLRLSEKVASSRWRTAEGLAKLLPVPAAHRGDALLLAKQRLGLPANLPGLQRVLDAAPTRHVPPTAESIIETVPQVLYRGATKAPRQMWNKHMRPGADYVHGTPIVTAAKNWSSAVAAGWRPLARFAPVPGQRYGPDSSIETGRQLVTFQQAQARQGSLLQRLTSRLGLTRPQGVPRSEIHETPIRADNPYLGRSLYRDGVLKDLPANSGDRIVESLAQLIKRHGS